MAHDGKGGWSSVAVGGSGGHTQRTGFVSIYYPFYLLVMGGPCKAHAGPSRALRQMASLAFLLVFWVLADACQRHGVGFFLLLEDFSRPLPVGRLYQKGS